LARRSSWNTLQYYRDSELHPNIFIQNFRNNSKIMKKEDINARFIEAISYLMSSNQQLNKTTIASSLNAKPSKFSEILNMRMNVPAEMIAQLCDIYNVNPTWLLTGKGKIVTNSDNLSTVDQPTAEATPSVDPSMGIPLIPIDAMAGYLRGEVSVMDADCDRFVIPGVVADYIIPVRGDSMVPLYHSGDLVACRRLSLSDLFFQWGKAYVLDTTQGVVLKRLRPGSSPDTVLLVSENTAYDPFELHRDDIYHIAIVTALVRIL
jgi:phage repressor protein C with HTH and peptisase S24 domain